LQRLAGLDDLPERLYGQHVKIEEMPNLAFGLHDQAAFALAAISASTSMPWSSSASVTISGGSRRTTLSAALTSSRPLARAWSTMSALEPAHFRPRIRPRPRTSVKTWGKRFKR